MIKNKKIALVFRLISLVIAISGIISVCTGPDGTFSFRGFAYYTIQSNFLAVILFAILSFKTLMSLKDDNVKGAGFFPRFEMVCVIDLLLTLIVYWVLLAPSAFAMNDTASLLAYENLVPHLVTPLLCLIDYILFTKSNHLKYSDVYLVVIYPLFYVTLSTIMGFSGYVFRTSSLDGSPVRFPYFFFDYDRTPPLTIAMYVIGLIIVFLIISHIFYLFDKKVVKKVLMK